MVRRQKKNRTTLWITIGISLLMILSVAGFFSDSLTPNYTYGKHKFTVTDSGLTTKINGKSVTFRYSPSQLESVPVQAGVIAALNNSKAVALTFTPYDPEVDLVRYDLNDKLPTVYGIYVQNGIREVTAGYSLPLISCLNATPQTPVISLEEAREPALNITGGCIIVYGDSATLPMAMERLTYGLSGIMNATG